MNYFTFREKQSKDFDMGIQRTEGLHSSAERDISIYEVPGRDGNLTIDNGRYRDIEIIYHCVVLPSNGHTLPERTQEIKSWLMADTGYHELRDTYIPNCFRMARIANKIDFEDVINKIGSAPIIFSCRPYLYLDSGQEMITLTEEQTVINPTAFQAKPVMKLYGSGLITLSIQNQSWLIVIPIDTEDESITIDSELMEAYNEDAQHLSGNVKGNGFPNLLPGNNAISWTGNCTKIEIIPRWATL